MPHWKTATYKGVITLAKLTRGKYIVYLDTSFGTGTSSWYKIGKSLSSLDVELNPDVSTERNIFDETYATDNGYTPQTTVEPYYADPDDSIYEKILDIAMNRKVGDDCRTKIMEVVIDNETGSSFNAWTEDVLVKPTKTGGDTAGFSIPYDIYFDGGRQSGKVSYSDGTYKNGTPTFTPSTAA